MPCSKCGHINRPDAKFCAHCRQPLTPPMPVAPVAPPTPSASPVQAYCSQCSQPLRAGAQFCRRCGARQQPAPVMPAAPPSPAVYVPPVVSTPVKRARRPYALRHGLIGGVLTLGLIIALAGTFAFEKAAPPKPTDPPPVVAPVTSVPTPVPTADYRQAVVKIGFMNDGRFGLSSTTGDPANRSDDGKSLTFDANGGTNNTRISIDGETPMFGEGGLAEVPHQTGGQIRAVWQWSDIEVVQTLSYINGTSTGRVDTMQIKYTLTNKGSRTRQVGLRIMLDTLIGDNDGVPFVVPGRSGITTQAVELRGDDVPDFIQALEVPNLTQPGVIVHLTLQGADATRPDRLVLAYWPGSGAGWDYPQQSIEGDSSVGLYFDPQALAPGKTRTLITYYGLGGISSTKSGNPRVSLTFNQVVRQGDSFWITALVADPKADQKMALELPAGLELSNGYNAEQAVTGGGDYTQISWRVIAKSPITNGVIKVTLQPGSISESQTITALPVSITK